MPEYGLVIPGQLWGNDSGSELDQCSGIVVPGIHVTLVGFPTGSEDRTSLSFDMFSYSDHDDGGKSISLFSCGFAGRFVESVQQ